MRSCKMMLTLLMVVAVDGYAWISCHVSTQIPNEHTVIVKPPAAAVAGIDVVAVPVARVDDMVDQKVYGGDGDMVTVLKELQQEL
jgi:hypothetical protein